MNRSDEALNQSPSGVFFPYHHQDFYAMDSLFLSEMRDSEIWDFQSVPGLNLSFLGFLSLRAMIREAENLPKLELRGLSKVWKSYLAKQAFFASGVPIITSEFIPNLVGGVNEKQTGYVFGPTDTWKQKFTWEKKEKHSSSIFYCAVGNETMGDIGVSELLKEFLSYSQKDHHLEQAYIRKESSNYLYLNQKDGNPRVYFRENKLPFPPFLFLIAELKSKSLIPSG
ncbi:hypothetical protein P3G55_16370 [Leptospira sp. 96542]|nr:hypothetical protein [Leptospira sp. 96542]